MTTSIPLEIEMNGRADAVFDIITQVRLWPRWHVLTRSVCGTTERPFRPGDSFTEFIRTEKGTQELEWRVVEYEHAKRVSISLVGGDSIISYDFLAGSTPGTTLFRRTVRGTSPREHSVTPETEAASVKALKVMVEEILANEHKGPKYPPPPATS